MFKDLTPVVGNADLFREAVGLFADRHRGAAVDRVAAIEARGFLFGGALAAAMGVGLIPVRKKGKLPWRVRAATYDLEYGTATIEVHEDAITPGERILLIDDLLATGGTAAAAAGLIESLGGVIVEIDFLVELGFLKGRERLGGRPAFAPVVF